MERKSLPPRPRPCSQVSAGSLMSMENEAGIRLLKRKQDTCILSPSTLCSAHHCLSGIKYSLKMIQVVGLAAYSQCLTELLCVLGQEATVCQPVWGKTHRSAVPTRHCAQRKAAPRGQKGGILLHDIEIDRRTDTQHVPNSREA